MAPEPTPILALPPPSPTRPLRDKVRIRFRKDGDLRLLSHHDLMRSFERMLRRAALPFRSPQGFHPKPRLVFALSLPLGVVGCEEVVELELDEMLPPEEVRERLVRQAPPGLEILQSAPHRLQGRRPGALADAIALAAARRPRRRTLPAAHRRGAGRAGVLGRAHAAASRGASICGRCCVIFASTGRPRLEMDLLG